MCGGVLCFCVVSVFLSGIYEVHGSFSNLVEWFWLVAKDANIFLCEPSSSLLYVV